MPEQKKITAAAAPKTADTLMTPGTRRTRSDDDDDDDHTIGLNPSRAANKSPK